MIGPAVRIVQLNLAWDAAIGDADQLLDTYHTLTGWADALVQAGAHVTVAQRFSTTCTFTRGGVRYVFSSDGEAAMPQPWSDFTTIAACVAREVPDLVHVNGLMFPGAWLALRRLLRESAIVVQDHSGARPRRRSWLLGAATARRWRAAFREIDAVTFTSRALGAPWYAVGLPDDLTVIEIPEASTTLRGVDPSDASVAAAVRGSPALLWVGRLDRNKDPITVLDACERSVEALPQAHLTMLVPAGADRREVDARIAGSPVLTRGVSVTGPIPRREMPSWYSRADVYISGSHHEGSGYALIEAMACGVVPCVTDIPAFRALTGECGLRWPAGDSRACASALIALCRSDLAAGRACVRTRFERELSWRAIGRRTFEVYASLIAARRARS